LVFETEDERADLILRLEDSTIKDIFGRIIPGNISKWNGLFPLLPDNLHITLTSPDKAKAFKDVLKSSLPTDIPAPDVQLGEVTIANREDKTSFVVAVANQEELKAYVDQVYQSMGLENPEPDRYFHITIANNVKNEKFPNTADSFGSIGDITKNDFKRKD
jgi:hypothetical protein